MNVLYLISGLKYKGLIVPTITVLMPVYNTEKYIEDSINSILNQSFVDFELLIIDDGSTDNSVAKIEKFNDKRIILIKNKKNLGLASVRNIGLNYINTKYIAFLDSDDISSHRRLEKQFYFLENNSDYVLCGSWVETIGKSKHIWKYKSDSELLKCQFIFSDPFATSSLMIRNKVLTENNLIFDISFPPCEDYDLWERVTSYGEIYNIPEVLTYYRIHNTQTSTSDANKIQFLENDWRVQRRVLKKLEVEITPALEEVHKNVRWENFKKDSESYFYKYKKWLIQLCLHNKKNQVFTQKAFMRIVAEKWYSLLISSSLSKKELFTEYLNSPFRKSLNPNSNILLSYYKFLRFVFHCLKKR